MVLGNWRAYFTCPLKLCELWIERSSTNTVVYHVEKVLGEWSFSIGKIRGVFTPHNYSKAREYEYQKNRPNSEEEGGRTSKLTVISRPLSKSNRKVS